MKLHSINQQYGVVDPKKDAPLAFMVFERQVFELEFYTDLACRGSKVVGEPISSAEDADLADLYSGHRNPHKAFDGAAWM